MDEKVKYLRRGFKMKNKITVEGDLFILEEVDGDEYHFTAEVGGFNIIDWFQMNKDCNVKITLEKNEE